MILVNRRNLATLLRTICQNPTYAFSVVCQRREDLPLRYEPIDRVTQGALVYVGDATSLRGGENVRVCPNCWIESRASSRKCRACGDKREKIILESAGTLRKMIVKGKNNNNSTKHWDSKGGTLPFNPADHDLFLVSGMYNDAASDYGTGRRIGRHGSWRPWAMICLRTTEQIKYSGEVYQIVEDEIPV